MDLKLSWENGAPEECRVEWFPILYAQWYSHSMRSVHVNTIGKAGRSAEYTAQHLTYMYESHYCQKGSYCYSGQDASIHSKAYGDHLGILLLCFTTSNRGRGCSFNWTSTPGNFAEISKFLGDSETPAPASNEELDDADPDDFFALEEDYLADVEQKIENDPNVEETVELDAAELIRDEDHALIEASEVDVVPPASGGSQLLSHPELQKWALAFNRVYGIFVCMTCQGGLAIDQLHRHLSVQSSKCMRPNPEVNQKVPYKELTMQHEFRPIPPCEKDLQSQIRATLALLGASGELATAAELKIQWQASKDPSPVEGVYMFENAQRCLSPGCGAVLVDSVYEHNKLHKSRTAPQYEQKVHAQSLLLTKTSRYYRHVSGEIPANIPQTGPSSITLEALQAQTLPSADVEAVQALRKNDLHRFTITVAHQRLGVPEFHARFKKEGLPALLDPPKKWSAATIERLDLIQRVTSRADIEAFQKSPGTLREQILVHTRYGFTFSPFFYRSASPRSQAKNPVFTIPRTSENYLPMQRQLVYLLINIYQLGKFELLPMSDDLRERVENLVQTLRKPMRREDRAGQAAFRDVLDAVYFPPTHQWSSERGLGTVQEVLLAIKCMGTRSRAMSAADLIPPMAAKLQFFLRLRAIAKLQPNFEKLTAKEAYDLSSTFCEQYLNELCPSPYSGVRQWLHEFTSVVLRTPRPYNVQWTDKQHENLILEGHPISKKDYCLGIRQRLQKLEDFVREKVLFGIDVGDVRSQLDTLAEAAAAAIERPPVLSANSENSVVGSNPQSDVFAAKVLAQGHLALSAGGALDRGKTMRWREDVRRAFYDTHALVHTTEGLPGRGTEDHVLELRDMVYEPVYHAFAITPVVRKTQDTKNVIRLLPEAVSVLLYILIRIVRPLECLAHLRFESGTDKRELLRLYDTNVWAIGGQQMKSRSLSKNLATWLGAAPGMPGFDFRMGIKLYRHFATALDRDLGGLKRDASHNIGDYQAGRVAATSHRNYAVEKGLENFEPRKLQIQKSLDWHRAFISARTRLYNVGSRSNQMIVSFKAAVGFFS
ncbi:hypothetical protein DFH07DRAFT_784544 [Mycena maculata]|uniref:Uncharacterized protein n=1 Tax=Mycena maculata TaxID=230809 RepID=A0AAD7MJ28_9AGAR|nr:hypothetical protein DFH07DRAFT_784544 [Mycena maculata]